MASEGTKSTRLAEFGGLLCFGVALMLLISLATYHPHDPAPFFKAGADGPAGNFIGPFGAFLAELLVPQLFGAAAILLPLMLAITGWTLFWCRPLEAPYTKAFGLLLLLGALTAFLALTFGIVPYEGEPVRAGGAVAVFRGQTSCGRVAAEWFTSSSRQVAGTPTTTIGPTAELRVTQLAKVDWRISPVADEAGMLGKGPTCGK